MLDSTGYAELIKRKPLLVHLVWEPDQAKLDSILEHGLASGGNSHYGSHWASRPGHVYLADAAYAVSAGHLETLRASRPRVFCVDTAKLEPASVNPDEDHFLPNNPMDLGTRNQIDGRHVLRYFHKPWPPAQWLREWTDYLRLPSLPSLGEWAEQSNLGHDPAETLYSIRKGSLAYRGVIPPDALRLAGTGPC